MDFWLTKLTATLALPPLSLYLLAILGLLLARRWQRTGWATTATALVALWVFSTPLVSGSLIRWIEPERPADLSAVRRAGAIVVLGSGTYHAAPEYGGDTTGTVTLERLRWAARLHRETGLPLLVSGGSPLGGATTEAAQMQEALTRDFGAVVRWVEDRADNTRQSADLARAILAREGIQRVALVTHASHMRRARREFLRAGFDVVDAPTGFSTRGPLNAMSFLPNATAMAQTRTFCHEALGIGWYHVRRLFTRND